MPDTEDSFTLSFSGCSKDLLARLEERAEKLDRSRAWVIRDAIERGLAMVRPKTALADKPQPEHAGA